MKRLTAYALIGQEVIKLRDGEQKRIDKIKKIMGTISDDDFEQLCRFAERIEGKEAVEKLRIMRRY
jgi:hypothetical protein